MALKIERPNNLPKNRSITGACVSLLCQTKNGRLDSRCGLPFGRLFGVLPN